MDTYIDRAVGKAYDGERLCEAVEFALLLNRKFMGPAVTAAFDRAVAQYRERNPDQRGAAAPGPAQAGGAL
jgi:hypothetical protein